MSFRVKVCPCCFFSQKKWNCSASKYTTCWQFKEPCTDLTYLLMAFDTCHLNNFKQLFCSWECNTQNISLCFQKKKKKLFESKDDFTCFQHERNVKNAVNSTGKYMAFVKKLWKFSGFADRSIVVVQYNKYKGVVNFSDQQKWAISSVTTQWSLVPSWPFMLTCSSPSASKTEQRWNTALQVVSCNTW